MLFSFCERDTQPPGTNDRITCETKVPPMGQARGWRLGSASHSEKSSDAFLVLPLGGLRFFLDHFFVRSQKLMS